MPNKNHETSYSSKVDAAVAKCFGWREFTWYDGFFVDRYQTVDIVDLVNASVPEMLADGIEDFPDDWYDKGLWEHEKYLQFIEDIIECNVHSFVYDW
jgi:hypothetical protein